MNKLKAIILDDEDEAINILSSLLIDTNKVDVIKKLKDPLKLESSVSSLNPDAVFTDIQMPKYNGLEILKNLREYRPDLPVVYITAHEKFALEAAKYNPFSYLLKPVDFEELDKVVDGILKFKEIIESKSSDEKGKITLSVKEGMLFVYYDEILCMTSDSNYTMIKLTDGKEYVSSYNLGKIHKLLKSKRFVRVNRQTVVNYNYMKEINVRKKYCILKCKDFEEKLPISRTFLQTVK